MIELFLILLGLSVGSFLNVVIYRIPRKEPIILSRSHCPKCGAKIKFYDNIPILSYIILWGKCRDCHAPISIKYPLVEALTAILFLVSYYWTGNIFNFIISLYLSSIMVAITFIDIDERIIPDIITYPGIVIGILSSLLRYDIGIVHSLFGVFVGAGVLTFIAIFGSKAFKKEAMGFGDVKLMGLLGAFLGPQKVLLVILLSSFFGAIGGLIGLILAKDKESAHIIPYGPYIALASLPVFWWGDKMINWYISLFI